MDFATIKGFVTALLGSGGIQDFLEIIQSAENEVAQLGELVAAGAFAPERLDTAPPGRGVNAMVSGMPVQKKLTVLPLMIRVVESMSTCGKYMQDHIKPARQTADEGIWQKIQDIASQHEATAVGFTRISDHDIFKDFAIPYRNAIVFTIEMDQEAINTAPGYDALIEVLSTYASLGQLGIRLTDYLRDEGYAAYPGFPVRGLVDYVRVAQAAGIGAIGYHGLLISPDAGTRQRINLVFTNMELPESSDNPHEWILDFCAKCLKCVRSCPSEAIFSSAPIHPETGRKQTVHYEKCLDYYGANQGCAVCVKVCPFSQAGYDKIAEGFLTAQAR